MADFNDVRQDVDASDGVKTVRMAQLRDALGWQRLSDYGCEQIHSKLAGVGLGHYPELEADASQAVRLYVFGSPIGDLVGAATTLGDEGDKRLRKLAESDAEETLRQVRAVLCD